MQAARNLTAWYVGPGSVTLKLAKRLFCVWVPDWVSTIPRAGGAFEAACQKPF
jgi:hypothetical protein